MRHTYLVRTTTSDRGTAMEYRVLKIKRDMRTTFCQIHEADIVDSWELTKAIVKHGMKIKDDRVIAPNGKTAYEFAREIGRAR